MPATVAPVATSVRANFDAWEGTFVAQEACGKSEEGDPKFASHRIKVVKQDDQWLAEITGDGYQTATHLRARLEGAADHVKLTMVEALAENLTDGLEPGEILLEWKGDGKRITTLWKKLSPLCEANRVEPQFTHSRISKPK